MPSNVRMKLIMVRRRESTWGNPQLYGRRVKVLIERKNPMDPRLHDARENIDGPKAIGSLFIKK